MRPFHRWMLGLVVVTGACRSESTPGPVDTDAGATATSIVVAELGLRMELPPTWTLRRTSSAAAVGPVRTWAEARRAKDGRQAPLLVPARVVITSEPASGATAEEIFAHILAELESIGERPGVTLERSGFSSRTLAGFETARLRVRYRVGGTPGTQVRHESLAVLRPPPAAGAPSVVTVTATYAARDAPAVEAEIERAFERVELTPAEGSP